MARFTQPYLDRLRNVSVSTRLLTLALAVMLLMGFFLVSLYAGRPTMVPLPLTLTGESRNQTIDYLASRNLDYEDTGTAILVRNDSRDQIITQLNEASVITPDQIDFDRMIKDERMFLTKGQQRTRTRVATQNVLARMISQMANVKKATVVISGEEEHVGIGRAFVPRTASVSVVTDSGALSPQTVDAIARTVAGSTTGLKAESVSVIDARTGRAMTARPDDAMASTINMEIKLAAEKMALTRLEEALGYIPGIRISVNAVVQTREMVRETTSFEDPKLGVTQETLSESNLTAASRGQEPGVRANLGLRVTTPVQAMGRSGPTSSDSTEHVESVPAFGRSDQRVVDPGGYALEINTSIGVPWSYFAALHRQRTGIGSSEPVRGEAFDALIGAKLESIEAQVLPLIATGSAEGSRQGEVTVTVFEDVASPAMNSGVEAAGWIPPGDGDTAMFTTIGLVILAGLALGMMFWMVRRVGAASPPGPELLAAAEQPLLVDDVDVLGDVDDTEVVLDGVEIETEEVRRRVMLDQIREAVQAHPEESAAVLRRWTRTET
ncbi:MAG: hypothetical protein MK116_01285 [Phycisphaerales bacterium]|nr:hypothetical protein [Phycisphaerales bacterium]